MAGFAVVHRRALEHPLLSDAARLGAWTWLVASACWKPTRVKIKGEVIALERGELTFSQRFLAEKWGWSKSRVDRFIAELRDAGMIATRTKSGPRAGQSAGQSAGQVLGHNAGQGQSIITICNYAKYQDVSDGRRGNVEPHCGATAGQQRGKEEQGNKNIPLSNDNGAADLWSSAVSYLGEKRRSLIGKWCRDYGAGETAKAITEAQINHAAEPVSYIERTLRKSKATAGEIW